MHCKNNVAGRFFGSHAIYDVMPPVTQYIRLAKTVNYYRTALCKLRALIAMVQGDAYERICVGDGSLGVLENRSAGCGWFTRARALLRYGRVHGINLMYIYGLMGLADFVLVS
jgi:hypothetical protein